MRSSEGQPALLVSVSLLPASNPAENSRSLKSCLLMCPGTFQLHRNTLRDVTGPVSVELTSSKGGQRKGFTSSRRSQPAQTRGFKCTNSTLNPSCKLQSSWLEYFKSQLLAEAIQALEDPINSPSCQILATTTPEHAAKQKGFVFPVFKPL